ncbi:MAG: hypothetical protein ACJAS0_002766 [Alcanivorax borkumensis]|jgi:hypothetical protein
MGVFKPLLLTVSWPRLISYTTTYTWGLDCSGYAWTLLEERNLDTTYDECSGRKTILLHPHNHAASLTIAMLNISNYEQATEHQAASENTCA